MGRHRRRDRRVHPGPRGPARAGRADRRGRPGRGRAADERGGRRGAVPGDPAHDARRRPGRAARPPAARRPGGRQQPALRRRVIGRSPRSGRWRPTSARARRSSSSSTTPIAATRGCRIRSRAVAGSAWPPRRASRGRRRSAGSRAGSSGRSTPRSSRRPSAATEPVEVAGVVVALRRDADEHRGRRIGRARAGAEHRPGHQRHLDPVLVEQRPLQAHAVLVSFAGQATAPPPSIRPSRREPAAGPPSAATSRSRASSASARFAAMTAGQPPGSSAAIQSIAAGMRERRGRVAGADPVELEAEPRSVGRGWRWRRATRCSGGSARAGRRGPTGTPRPSARTATCGRCPCSTRPRARRARAAPSPGRGRRRRACRSPRASSSRTRRSIGRTRPVGLVTWLSTASRVRGVTAASTASTISSSPAVGKGRAARTTRAPSRSAAARIVLSVALYSWSRGEQLVARLEPERMEHGIDAGGRVGDEGEARRVGAEERPDGLPRPVEVAFQLAGPGTRTGSRSRRSRHSRWTARTGAGHAPNEPWLRYVTSGSRVQPRSVRIALRARSGRRRGRRPVARRRPGRPRSASAPRPRRRPATARRPVRDDDGGPLGQADEAEIRRHAGRVASDGPLPRRGIRVRGDADARDDPEALDARRRGSRSTRRGPSRRRWRPRARRPRRGHARWRPRPPSPGRASG